MSPTHVHLIWSSVLLLLGIFLVSISVSLLKLSGASLTFPQTMALIFVGSFASAAPFAGVIWRRWDIRSRTEVVFMFLFGAFLAGGYAVDLICSQHMLHGKLILG